MISPDLRPVPGPYVIGNKVHWVLDADLNSIDRNGTTVQLWEYQAGANQNWLIEPAHNGFFKIRCPASGRVLDADLWHVHEDRCRVQLYDDLGGANQLWEILATTDGGYVIRNVASEGRVLDADWDHLDRPGTPIQLYRYVPDNPNQHWGFRNA